MILPYAWRLLCLCLATFFLVHLALSLLMRALAPWILRRTERMGTRQPASAAALLLLAVRLFPPAFAIAFVVGLCLPSFLAYESERGAETAGAPFLAAAAFGASVWALSLARSVRALIRSQRCMPRGAATLAGGSEAVWLWEGSMPFVGLAGILRPRVIVSRSVTRALDANQLAAALRHEHAHRVAADNLKRLFLLLAPDALPGLPLFRAVERSWARFVEWAADDMAVAQDVGRSVSLAEALVRVARLGATPQLSPIVSRFAPADEDVSTRVNRLLNGPPPVETRSRRFGPTLALAAVAAPFVAAIGAPGSLSAIHELLERWMH